METLTLTAGFNYVSEANMLQKTVDGQTIEFALPQTLILGGTETIKPGLGSLVRYLEATGYRGTQRLTLVKALREAWALTHEQVVEILFKPA